MNIEISWQRFSKPSRIHWKKIHKKKNKQKKLFSIFKKKIGIGLPTSQDTQYVKIKQIHEMTPN